MVTFDTIKFSFPFNLVKSFNSNLFRFQKTHEKKIILISSKAISLNPATGIKCITIDFVVNRCIIEISAKILLYNYKDGINHLNFESILENINKLNIIHFIPSEIINYLNFYRVDTTKNIYFAEPIENAIQSLSLASETLNFAATNYRNNSIVFVKNPSSKKYRLRFIFYNKYKELCRDKNFQKICDISQFENILRFEVNFVNFSQIRKYFKIEPKELINFDNVFKTKQNVNREIFLELVYKSQSQIQKFCNFDFKTNHAQTLKNFGMLKVCEIFNFDYDKIKLYVKSKVKGNISHYLRAYKKIINSQNENKNSNNIYKTLNKIYNEIA